MSSTLKALSLAALACALALSSAPSCADQGQAKPLYEALPSGAYAVVAEVRAKPGMEAQLRDATLPLIASVRNEANNMLYFLHENRESPGHFVFYEIFASKEDFEAHNQTPHVQRWFAKLPDLAVGDVKVLRLEPLHARTAAQAVR